MSMTVPPQGYQANPVVLREVSIAGAATLETGELLTKDVLGRTEFFYEDDLGVQIQLTSAGGINMAAASGILSITHGGTGLALAGAANTVLGVVNAGGSLEYKAITAGTNMAVVHAAGTITLNSSQTPTITSFVNAAHNHTDAAGGAQLTDAAFSAAVGLSKGGSGLTTTGTANQFLGMVAIPGGMEWKSFAAGAGISVTHAAGLVTIANTSPGVTDHGALTGLTPDDDHTQYALLAGRAASQTLIGSTASAGTLTLQATASTSAGAIIFNSKTGTQIGQTLATGEWIFGSATTLIGSEFVSVQKSFNGVTLLGVYNATNNTAASAQVLAKGDVAQIAIQVFATNYTGAGKLARLYATGANKFIITTADTCWTQIGANGYGYLTVYDGGSVNLGGADGTGLVVQYPLSMTTTYAGISSVISWNKSDNAACCSTVEIDAGTTNLVDGRLYVTNNNGYASSQGRVASEFSVWSLVGGIGLIANAAQVIRFATTATERMRILAASNTLQGNAGLTIQGGAGAANILNLSATAHGTPGPVNICVTGTTVSSVFTATGALCINATAVIGTEKLYVNGSVNLAATGNLLWADAAKDVRIGSGVLAAKTTGTVLIAIGLNSMSAGIITGNNDIGIGQNSLDIITDADGCIGIGTSAGDSITTGDDQICIGRFSDAGAATTITVALGYNAIVSASNTIALGGTGANACAVVIGATAAVGTEKLLVMGGIRMDADGGLDLRSQTDKAGASAGTLANAPTAGNPAIWVPITVNGTNYAFGAWALPQ